MIRWALLGTVVACSATDSKPKHIDPDQGTAEPTPEVRDTGDPDDTGEPIDVPADPDDACDGLDPAPGFPSGTIDCVAGTCRVPEGRFYMGSLLGHPDECPTRQLSLPEFRIDKTEVTWGAYEECVATGDCEAVANHCRAWASGLSDGDPSQLPVTCVTWEQARTYCQHKGGKLPSEAEWEKAARGTQGAWWPWGGATPTCEFSNFRFVSWYCAEGVVEVGSYRNESSYGALDMTGNAWEWVEDFYDAEWYREAPGTDGPTENCRTTVGATAEACSDRVMRGGAYNVTEFNTRTSARAAASPDLVDNNIGFRCAYSD